MAQFSDESRQTNAGFVAPSQSIRQFIKNGVIASDTPICSTQIQPASLDLRLGLTACRVRASFLPRTGATVAAKLRDLAMHEIDLSNGAVLETGCVYVVPLLESVHLPKTVSAIANAKSSIGRLDVFTRLITDQGEAFDHVQAGYSGPLYAEISPRAFSVLAHAGARLNQIRFHLKEQALGQPAPARAFPFSVDLEGRNGGPIGFRARPHSGLIDLNRVNHYDPAEFWDPIRPYRLGAGCGVILDPGAFYILVSRESVKVEPNWAAEMTPYLAMVGEFRVHYAGFFDPGFGCSEVGGAGSRGVLEVRCHETPFALEHGQVVGKLIYEPMLAPPDILYGTDIGSTYQAQGLRLSKHFQA
jgi:dCTP deaminase